MKLGELIGIVFIASMIVLNLGMWWATWDLMNTIIYGLTHSQGQFPQWDFIMPFYLQWFVEKFSLVNWSYAFDIFVAFSVVACILCAIGGYIIGKLKE